METPLAVPASVPVSLQAPARGPLPEAAVAGSGSSAPTADELNALIGAVATQADRAAFVSLFNHFAPRVNRYLVGRGMPAALAEDLAQETLVIVWKRAPSFDPKRAALSTWIFTIARNLRIDHHRRTASEDAAADPWADAGDPALQPADVGHGPEELLFSAQLERCVHDAVGKMPADQGRLLQLMFFEERPHARIARELGIPLGTVKSRIRAAIAQLRSSIEHLAP